MRITFDEPTQKALQKMFAAFRDKFDWEVNKAKDAAGLSPKTQAVYNPADCTGFDIADAPLPSTQVPRPPE